MTLRESLLNVLNTNEAECVVPVWTQFKAHKGLFEVAKNKMQPFASYYNPYKNALKNFEDAAASSTTYKDPEVLTKLYGAMWKILFDFFTSKEYLSSYSSMFLHTKGKKEREDMITELFDIKQIDLDKEFYEILIHLIYKQLLSEKYANLRNLQRIIRIERKWKDYLKRHKNLE